MSEHVLIERDGTVLTIRLNRPDKKNALTREMYNAMGEALSQAAGDDGVHAVILAGGQDFTAGNDLKDFASVGDRPAGEPGSAFNFLENIVAFPKPVIAAVRGYAVGIGTTMLLHCDVVVASETARLQMPFTRLGLVPEAGSSLLLAGRVGVAKANWWLLSGAQISGAEAAASGLASRAVPDNEVDPAALEMAKTLAALPPGAMAETKRLVRAPQAAALAEVMAAERVAFGERLRTEEAQAIFASFLKK
ncbi:enoyl-CoA hydratase-related protein [Roseococcus pinisoli]|uniref:Enoyl-CoA hydratase/isomerase family protein n=1 Tax=Roseococcus pinisoli TaxID=2835040 RepID=A0ABS5Q8S5_9PROT|nr:enoyl-CoA hydratase-related protein [Roseococcus pinisoli]MBS7810109.1 enoyl-CoA hydratase/isomerase family protein [Roseococcus pinisoli]